MQKGFCPARPSGPFSNAYLMGLHSEILIRQDLALGASIGLRLFAIIGKSAGRCCGIGKQEFFHH
jgi:hypothetical protein